MTEMPGAQSLPALHFTPELLLAAQGVRVAFFDVDGVLTDGGIYFSEAGETLKRFHTLDGHGLKLLQKAGIVPAVITGRDSAPLRLRLSALGVEHAVFGTAMGDDWPDLPVMQRARFACAPPDAHVEVRSRAHHITAARAGVGAAREFCDLLLMANGAYARLLADYCP